MRIGRADLHFWEEPPLKNSGAIFFTHCSLRCVYCQNWRISQADQGRDISIKNLTDLCFELKDKGAENINIVTGTHYAPQIAEGLTEARKQGLDLPIVWNTSSYENVETIKFLTGLVDVWLADFKYTDDHLANALSGINNYCEVATNSIQAMIEGSSYCKKLDCPGVIIRHLVMPGFIEHSKKTIEKVWQLFGISAKLSIMSQYTPIINDRHEHKIQKVLEKYPSLARTLKDGEYEEVLDYADSLGIEDYFWQDGEACKESFIPDFNLQD